MTPRELTPAELLSVLIPLAVAALAMVFAMVQWSTALLEAEPPATSRRKWLWGAVYAGLWAVLVALFLRLFLLLEGRLRPGAVGVLALAVAGWWAFNGLFIWFGRALQRAQARAGAAARAPEAEGDVAEPEAAAEEAPEPPVGRRRARKKPPRLVRRAVSWGIMIALVFVAMVLGELPPLKALEAWMEPRETPLLVVVGSVAALGFVLLMGGVIHLVLTAGQPMSHAEAEEFARRTRDAAAGPAAARRSAYLIRGKTLGTRGSIEVSFSEVKEAWRAGAWRWSLRWRQVFVMFTGGLLLTFGLFALFLVAGPAWVKLLVGAAMAYAAVMLVRGFRRA